MRSIHKSIIAISALTLSGLGTGFVFPSASLAQNSFSNPQLLANGWTIQEALMVFKEFELSGEVTDPAKSTAKVKRGKRIFYFDGYNCDKNRRCTEFLFSIGFDLPEGMSLEKINEWNSRELAGRAYLDDENDPWLDHVVSILDRNDDSALEEGIALWIGALDKFENFIFQEEPDTI